MPVVNLVSLQLLASSSAVPNSKDIGGKVLKLFSLIISYSDVSLPQLGCVSPNVEGGVQN